MINDDDKKTIEEIVSKAMGKILEDSGVNKAMETINKQQRITKEEIMAVKNGDERRRLIAENMDLFKKEVE